jgi:hypothetical protein
MLSIPKLPAALAATALLVLALATSAGASWTVAPGTVLPNPGLTSGVSCPTASACMVTGQQSGTTSTTLAAGWDGTSFTQLFNVSTVATPLRTSCPTIPFCMTVGFDDSGATAVPWAERWDDTVGRFFTTSMAVPSGSLYAQTLGVSCTSSSDCWAVGWFQNTTNNKPFIEHWNGSSWSTSSFTLPTSTNDAKLIGVSCTSSTACTAVGFYEATGQQRRALALSYNGTSWTPQTPALPAPSFGSSDFENVSCDSASRCMAVGDWVDDTVTPNVQHALAEAWNGTAWSVRTVPDPSGQTDPVLEGVSCVTSPAYACEAVGYATPSALHLAPLAAGFSGSTWTLQPVAVPSGTTDNALYDVSCPTTCLADGLSVYSTLSGTRPWVELGP